MRGLLLHAFTRIYFSDETPANAACPVLALVPPERRKTLIAERQGEGLYVSTFICRARTRPSSSTCEESP